MLLSMYVKITTAMRNEDGAVASEYAILLALIAAAMVAAVVGLGGAITARITDATGQIGN